MGIRGFRSWFESQFPDSMVAFSKDDSVHLRGQRAAANNNRNNSNAASASTSTTTTSPSTTTAESFDHVLIDMNQLLHIVLRKSRSDGHGLTLLIMELDAIVQRVATPQQSLVLAMDGPPSAAKLATQRRRRFQTVTKTNFKVQKLEQLLRQHQQPQQQQQQSTATTNSTSTTVSRKKQKQIRQWNRKKRRAASETRTLCISPATEFMAKAEQAILYWAWQRLCSRHSPLRNVKIFVSGSTVPGEGEVKLLEWIYHHRQRRGASVALLGGDSDLVLEALVVPLQITHNVFVLLPDGSRRYLAVNLWETTRQLDRLLAASPSSSSTAAAPATTATAINKNGTEQPQQRQQPTATSTSIRHMIRIRTDLVVLLMLNGNDYLPKLRGSSGFHRLFHTYLKLQREWRQQQQQENAEHAYLIDPDTLEYQLDFCIQFFGRLASLAAPHLYRQAQPTNNNTADDNDGARSTPLQELHNLVDMSFLPQPMEFRVVRDITDHENDDDEDDDDDGQQHRIVDEEEEEDSEDNVDNEGDVEGEEEDDVTNDEGSEEEEPDENKILIRLCLGEPGSENFYSCDVWHPRGVPLQKARQKLAAMALADLMEDEENADGDSDDDDDDNDGWRITSSGYEWELRHAVEGKVDAYLYGLLWCMQTYQDGVCVDYSYNYGKRLSPTAKEIVKFFTDAKRENRKVGPRELNPKSFTPPVSAEVSCLAALPSPVKHLVPQPYRNIPAETVEALYAKCMDPEDNVFDMKRFEELCDNEVSSMPKEDIQKEDASRTQTAETPRNGRRILMGDHYWTVISKVAKPLPHPFDPPEPFSDRFSKLRPNNRIRVSRLMALAEPRPRSAWNDDAEDLESLEIRHSDPGPFLSKLKTVDQVDYRLAYEKIKKRRGLRKAGLKIPVHVKEPSTVNGAVQSKDSSKMVAVDTADRSGMDVNSRMKALNIEPPPTAPARNKNGETAMAILKQLSDLEMIGPVKWETSAPSQSEYASFDPQNHELVRLIVPKSSNLKIAVLHEDLIYEQDRDINNASRKMLQHHLASFALCDITGPAIRWSEVSYQELRDFLAKYGNSGIDQKTREINKAVKKASDEAKLEKNRRFHQNIRHNLIASVLEAVERINSGDTLRVVDYKALLRWKKQKEDPPLPKKRDDLKALYHEWSANDWKERREPAWPEREELDALYEEEKLEQQAAGGQPQF